MCLARVEFVPGCDGDRPPLADVTRIERTPSGLRVVDLTGTVVEFDGAIQSVDFIDSVVQVGARSESREERA